jgi:hypothetical protein
MSLFDFFRRDKSAPDPTLDHPVFGGIQFVDEGLWEGGRVRFAPTNAEVDVSITAPVAGPDERHVRFVAELTERWPAFLRAAEPIVRRTLHKWIEGADAGEIWPRLKLKYLNVLPGVSAEEVWEITFWCEDAEHSLVIAMKGWDPEGASLHG